MMFQLTVSTALITTLLPKSLVRQNQQVNTGNYPFYRLFWSARRLKRVFRALLAKMRVLMPHRYDDDVDSLQAQLNNTDMGPLGGNVGRTAAASAATARL